MDKKNNALRGSAKIKMWTVALKMLFFLPERADDFRLPSSLGKRKNKFISVSSVSVVKISFCLNRSFIIKIKC